MVSLLCGLNEKKELNYFQKLVPLLFRNLGAVQLDDAHMLSGESLQVLAKNQPDFLVHSMAPILAYIISVTSSATLPWQTRQLILHLHMRQNMVHDAVVRVDLRGADSRVYAQPGARDPAADPVGAEADGIDQQGQGGRCGAVSGSM